MTRDFRNKYLLGSIRIIFGLFMLFSGTSGLLMGADSPEGVPEGMAQANAVLWETGILPLVKIMETLIGLLLVTNLFSSLATLAMVPITVGIVVVNANVAPAFLPIAIAVTLFNAYLVYAYWHRYTAFFAHRS